jgi:hypothetical protein
LLIHFDQPHRRDRPLADLLEPVLFLGLQFNLAGDLEQLRLGVLNVFTQQPQGEEPVAGLDRVAGKGVDDGDDSDGRRGDAAVGAARPVDDPSGQVDSAAKGCQPGRPRDNAQILPGLTAQFERVGGCRGRLVRYPATARPMTMPSSSRFRTKPTSFLTMNTIPDEGGGRGPPLRRIRPIDRDSVPARAQGPRAHILIVGIRVYR